ncbi:hypothetical protein V5F77_21300 [Xanthobacter sp. DSM 24535]|uniref:hypothetical protein n=1 Tax=Roseixanthobacter psychrophilus TaxID=3119917 RepID=UPI003729E1D3
MAKIAVENAGAALGGYDPDVPLASFAQARAAFLAGRSTPRQFLEESLERIERLDPVVRAFCFLDAASARVAADAATRRYVRTTARSLRSTAVPWASRTPSRCAACPRK